MRFGKDFALLNLISDMTSLGVCHVSLKKNFLTFAMISRTISSLKITQTDSPGTNLLMAMIVVKSYITRNFLWQIASPGASTSGPNTSLLGDMSFFGRFYITAPLLKLSYNEEDFNLLVAAAFATLLVKRWTTFSSIALLHNFYGRK